MTLCIAWKSIEGQIHLAADSRVSFGGRSADVAVKVASLPYRVVGVSDGSTLPPVIQQGEIGLACAGSTTAMFALKETIAEILLHLQSKKNGSISLLGICEIIFEIYRKVLPQVVAAMDGPNGVVNVIVTGYCHSTMIPEAYLIETNMQNQSSIRPILLAGGAQFELLGNGAKAAREFLSTITMPSREHFLNALQSVIDDPNTAGVGGHIVYGCTGEATFTTFGVSEVNNGDVSYWRAGLNFNDSVFLTGNRDELLVQYPMLMR
jgi:hypothetical protein